jgi:Na+/pantothenate symporter
VAGLLLAVVAAAILSSLGPIAVVISTVVVDDILTPLVSLGELQLRWLYPATMIGISGLCTLYLIIWGLEDILPFIYKTSFPVMFPPTLVALFGIYTQRTKARHAFWAIAVGVPTALVWSLVLKDPWGIHNIYVSMAVAGVILLAELTLDGQPAGKTVEITGMRAG